MLRAQLAWYKKRDFGSDKSEKLDPAQLKLAEVDEAKMAVAERTETITYERTKGPKPSRPTPAETFAHLPVTETIDLVPEPVKKDPELWFCSEFLLQLAVVARIHDEISPNGVRLHGDDLFQ